MNIYQVLPRLWGNPISKNKHAGTIQENGCGKMNAFTNKALREIKKMGYSHIWYTGIIAHASKTDYSQHDMNKDHKGIVKGEAGSPYAIKDYYDVDPDLAEIVYNRMQEFENLVNRTHENGLKVIIDFVPNHVAREYCSVKKPDGVLDLGETDNKEHAFNPQNNFYYIPNESLAPSFDCGDYSEKPAKATGNDHFSAHPGINDWYETVKLNYGVDYCGGGNRCFDPTPNTWFKMRDILLFWASKNIDGFRCDMAEMVPVEFWEWCIPQVKAQYPNLLFIAEVYNPEEYRNYIFKGKFDYLYDKVGLYDKLKQIIRGEAPAHEITHCWQSIDDIKDNMLNFLENHDEQRIASDFFAGSAEKAFPAMIIAACLTAAPTMVYFGQEFGEKGMEAEGYSGVDGRTTIFDYWNLKSISNWINGDQYNCELHTKQEAKIQLFYKKLMNIALNEKAIARGEMYDLMWMNFNNPDFNPEKHYAFIREYEGNIVLIVVNFSDEPADIGLNIEKHAFEYLQLKEKEKHEVQDLFTAHIGTIKLASNEKVKLKVPANNGIIFKIM